MNKPVICGIVVALIGVLAHLPNTSEAKKTKIIAVIVNKKNPLKNITQAELRDIFLKRRQVWPKGNTIIPINVALVSSLKKAFDKQVLGMSTQDIGEHWVNAYVTGRTTPPRRVSSPALAKKIVQALAGAISYIQLDQVDAKVKVLTIDGVAATDPDYKYKY